MCHSLVRRKKKRLSFQEKHTDTHGQRNRKRPSEKRQRLPLFPAAEKLRTLIKLASADGQSVCAPRRCPDDGAAPIRGGRPYTFGVHILSRSSRCSFFFILFSPRERLINGVNRSRRRDPHDAKDSARNRAAPQAGRQTGKHLGHAVIVLYGSERRGNVTYTPRGQFIPGMFSILPPLRQPN